MRLNKYLSLSGVTSRRKADELISSGRVLVDGKVAKTGQMVSEDNDVRVDNKFVKINCEARYFAFYKPRGIVTSLSDSQGEGIGKFLPKGERLFPVGRLDKESEGLLILTNDGTFAQYLSHPSREKQKVYLLEIAGKPGNIGKRGIEEKFVTGIKHDNTIFKVDKAKFISDNIIELQLHEGKNRQIRMIAGRIGLEVRSLKRVSVGKLKLSNLNLRPGKLIGIKKEDVI